MLRSFARCLLRLANGVVGARDFPLVAIEDGDFNIHGKPGTIEVGHVGVGKRRGEVALAVGFRQFVLALRRGHTLLSRHQVGTQLHGTKLQVLLIEPQGSVGKLAHHVVIGRYGFKAQQLAQAGQRLHQRQLCGRRHPFEIAVTGA